MKILVMSLTRMGDLVQATPVISGLRQKHPEAAITLMVTSDFAGFVPRIPDIDDSVVLDIRQFTGDGEVADCSWVTIYRYIEGFLDSVREQSFDLVVNLSHSRLSALMIHYLGIPRVCGFACNDTGDRMTLHPWMQYFGTEPFNRIYNPFNLVEIFTRAVDVAVEDQRIRMNPPESGETALPEEFEGVLQEGTRWIGIQAGSSLEGRRWPAQSFAELADLLAEQLDANILLFGVASESLIAKAITEHMRHAERVVDCTGRTSIPQLMVLLKRCSYLVTNDTGTMHIAAALGTPIVGLFFAHAHPYETGPYSPGHLIFQSRISCAPCSYGAKCNNVVCIDKVRPQHLLAMIEEHHRNGHWKLPPDMGPLDEVHIFETRFGADNRLGLRSLVRHPVGLQDVFRLAYERLWLSVLQPGNESAGTPVAETLRADHDCADIGQLLPVVDEKRSVLRSIGRRAGKGVQAAGKILRFCGKKGAEAKIQALGEEISCVDAALDLSGCTHPEVKPLVDLFLKRKENFQGEDLAWLAAETLRCYQTLIAETAKMEEILAKTVADFRNADHSEAVSVSRSMSALVPGR